MSSALIILAKESICMGKIEYFREKKYLHIRDLICHYCHTRSILGTSGMLQIFQSCKLDHEVAMKLSWKQLLMGKDPCGDPEFDNTTI